MFFKYWDVEKQKGSYVGNLVVRLDDPVEVLQPVLCARAGVGEEEGVSLHELLSPMRMEILDVPTQSFEVAELGTGDIIAFQSTAATRDLRQSRNMDFASRSKEREQRKLADEEEEAAWALTWRAAHPDSAADPPPCMKMLRRRWRQWVTAPLAVRGKPMPYLGDHIRRSLRTRTVTFMPLLTMDPSLGPAAADDLASLLGAASYAPITVTLDVETLWTYTAVVSDLAARLTSLSGTPVDPLALQLFLSKPMSNFSPRGGGGENSDSDDSTIPRPNVGVPVIHPFYAGMEEDALKFKKMSLEGAGMAGKRGSSHIMFYHVWRVPVYEVEGDVTSTMAVTFVGGRPIPKGLVEEVEEEQRVKEAQLLKQQQEKQQQLEREREREADARLAAVEAAVLMSGAGGVGVGNGHGGENGHTTAPALAAPVPPPAAVAVPAPVATTQISDTLWNSRRVVLGRGGGRGVEYTGVNGVQVVVTLPRGCKDVPVLLERVVQKLALPPQTELRLTQYFRPTQSSPPHLRELHNFNLSMRRYVASRPNFSQDLVVEVVSEEEKELRGIAARADEAAMGGVDGGGVEGGVDTGNNGNCHSVKAPLCSLLRAAVPPGPRDGGNGPGAGAGAGVSDAWEWVQVVHFFLNPQTPTGLPLCFMGHPMITYVRVGDTCTSVKRRVAKRLGVIGGDREIWEGGGEEREWQMWSLALMNHRPPVPQLLEDPKADLESDASGELGEREEEDVFLKLFRASPSHSPSSSSASSSPPASLTNFTASAHGASANAYAGAAAIPGAKADGALTPQTPLSPEGGGELQGEEGEVLEEGEGGVGGGEGGRREHEQVEGMNGGLSPRYSPFLKEDVDGMSMSMSGEDGEETDSQETATQDYDDASDRKEETLELQEQQQQQRMEKEVEAREGEGELGRERGQDRDGEQRERYPVEQRVKLSFQRQPRGQQGQGQWGQGQGEQGAGEESNSLAGVAGGGVLGYRRLAMPPAHQLENLPLLGMCHGVMSRSRYSGASRGRYDAGGGVKIRSEVKQPPPEPKSSDADAPPPPPPPPPP